MAEVLCEKKLDPFRERASVDPVAQEGKQGYIIVAARHIHRVAKHDNKIDDCGRNRDCETEKEYQSTHSGIQNETTASKCAIAKEDGLALNVRQGTPAACCAASRPARGARRGTGVKR
jgi:hypothetical protein